MRRGYVAGRSPDISLVPREPNYIGTADMPPHTGPWDYLVEVPLVFYGPGLIPPTGSVEGDATLADVAPTIEEMIGEEGLLPWEGRSLPVAATVRDRPRLVLIVVLDGVGRNTLALHDGASPFLEEMSRLGIDYADATVGSSPSNTPPIHTTLGTGVFPRKHGIPHVRMRSRDGGYVDPFEGNDADSVRVPTLADVYDRRTNNVASVGLVATVNWHLGMIGHGASFPGGDRDVSVLLNDLGAVYGDASEYALPDVADPAALQRFTTELDGADGELDGRWRGQDLTEPALRYMSPAWVDYQTMVLKRTIDAGSFGHDDVPDLLYVNFKGADTSGHRFGVTSPEVGEVVESQDDALRSITAFLDRHMGKKSWVVLVTADHGQTPYPEESDAYPIRGSELSADIESRFGRGTVQRVAAAGVFLTDKAPPAPVVARWLGNYSLSDNIPEGDVVPEVWRAREEENLFQMVLAGRRVMVPPTTCRT